MFAALDVTTTDRLELAADARPVGGDGVAIRRRQTGLATRRCAPSSRRWTPARRWTSARTR